MSVKRIYTLVTAVVMTVAAYAQVSVSSHIDSTEILVGSQTRLTVTAKNVPEGSRVDFPKYHSQTEMTPGIEVVTTKGDTVTKDGVSEIRRIYTLTAWDEGKYETPALIVKVGGKDFRTNSIPLKVNTIKIDTLRRDSILPNRGVVGNTFAWEEWSRLFWLSLIALLLFVVIYYLYVRLRDNKPVIVRMRFIKRLLPHEKALKKIEKIKAEHLDQSEDQKEYYTQLTDTLREYLEERFGIKAKEMTSAEILYRLDKEEDKAKIDELREVFETADLVKFAKYSVQTNENDLYMTSVVEFIDNTKQENQPTVEKTGNKLSEKDRRKIQTRKGLRLTIIVLIVTAIVILGYVAYRTYDLLS